MPRQSLGRGLSALLGDEKPAPKESATNDIAALPTRVNELDIDLIEPNPEQPRVNFAENELEELAASIRANGIVQPIVVRPKGENRYQIVAGERRWRAAQKAGLRKVPVSVKEVSDEKLLEIALIENIQRQQLNPIEEANAYRKLIDSIGLTQEEVAETRMMRHLSTNVKIVPAKKGTGGKIEIEYYGIDDLNRIYEMLTKNKGE